MDEIEKHTLKLIDLVQELKQDQQELREYVQTITTSNVVINNELQLTKKKLSEVITEINMMKDYISEHI